MNDDIETPPVAGSTPAGSDAYLLGCPQGVPPALYGWLMVSALALALSLGLQLLVAAVIITGPLKPWPAPETMTTMGQVMVHPEYDMLAYTAGLTMACVLLFLAALTVRLRAHRLARLHEFPHEVARAVAPGTALRIALAAGSLAAFLVCVEIVRRSAYERWVVTPLEGALLLVPALTAITALAVHGVNPRFWPRVANFLAAPPLLVRRAFDAAVFAGIVLLLFVPSAGQLAGRIYLREQFHHWDNFAIGPATQYALGASLGTEAFALYGIGFPYVLGALDPLLSLSHQNALHLLIGYGCIYFFGVYCLLRALRVARPAAALGVLLALLLTSFAPIWARLELATLWQWPSTTILRSPTDVWLFAALAMHARTANRNWLIAAAMAAFLGVFFITDTGLGLVLVLALYCGYWLLGPSPTPHAPPRATRLIHTGLAAGAGLFILATGLALASRGTMLTEPGRFFPGWLEAFLAYSGIGMWSLYFLARLSVIDIALFMALVALALTALIRGSLRALGRRPAADEVVIALLGFYALGRLIYFLHRTLPNNLHHAAVPVAVLLIVLGARYGGALCVYGARRSGTLAERGLYRFARAAAPVPLIALVAAGIWYSPSFTDYPGTLRILAKGAPRTGMYLLPDRGEIGGIPLEQAGRVLAFKEVVDLMRSMQSDGARVAMLDHTATIYYLTARVPPWGRDIGAYSNILFWDQLAAYQEAILADPPDIVLLRAEVPNRFFEDSWRSLREFLEQHAQRVHQRGEFDLFALPRVDEEAPSGDAT